MFADSNDNDNNERSGKNLYQRFSWLLDNQNISKIRASLGFFAVVDATWHLAVFTACYRYRPLKKFSQTATGQRLMHRFQKRMQSWNHPQNNHRQDQMHNNRQWLKHVPGGQRTMVAASEWFVVNKTIGIALLPSRLWLAKWLSEQEFFGTQPQKHDRLDQEQHVDRQHQGLR